MSSAEEEFILRWRNEVPVFSAWGNFIVQELSASISRIIAPVSVELFVRIPVKSRVKGEDSLLQKAFYRNKGYANPYEDIEDKVGLRFVVLLIEDIRIVEAAIVGHHAWIATKARDFVDERDQKPYEFDYQSVHFVLRSRLPFVFDSVEIPADIPCEVQIRTLLQHAYSELTHDTIYKPSVQATSALKRAAAKSMALIEATSDYFSSVHQVIKSEADHNEKVSAFISVRFEEWVGRSGIATPLNSLIIDHYKNLVSSTFEMDFDGWISKKSFVKDIVVERSAHQSLYRMSGILLVYYCVSKMPRRAKENSPLTDKELAPVYSDLGQAIIG